MERVRALLGVVWQRLSGLTASQKLVVVCLSIIGVLTLVITSLLTGTPARVELMPGAPVEEQRRVLTKLQLVNLDARMEAGELVVAREQYHTAMAHLADSGELPEDKRVMFSNLLQYQDWKLGDRENERQFVLAKQNELGVILSKMQGIREGSVILSVPEPGGLGRAAVQPSATVFVRTTSGGPLSQQQVDAVAGLVSGTVSGLTPARITVTDSAGGSRKASDPEGVASGLVHEQRELVERQVREKLERLVAHIPGAIVEVSAQMDGRRVETEETAYLPFDKVKGGSVSGIASEDKLDVSETAGERAATPGVSSQQTADIRYAPGAEGSSAEQKDARTEFENRFGTRVTRQRDARGVPTMLSASVQVPESFVRELIRREREADGAGAGDGAAGEGEAPRILVQDVDARFARLQLDIERAIGPHLRTQSADGEAVEGALEVTLALSDAIVVGLPGSGGLGGVGGEGGVAGLWAMSGQLIETGVIGVLAVVSLGMMIAMVRKAGKRPELPTAEELVGVPPGLQGDADVIGEVDESDSAMAGLEVDDAALLTQKSLDQVNALVDKDPATVAKLVRRWAEIEDK